MYREGDSAGSVAFRKSIFSGLSASLLVLYLIATLAFVWPVYRSFLNIKINENEGWNAYFADAALGRMSLYPAPAQWITNNYPPLSFYLVGQFGRWIGDTILAGRLISLAAVLALASLIAVIIKELGGDRTAGRVGGAFFVATISLFFDHYVGMNEPQLLAHAIMAVGFLLWIKATRDNREYALPICLMVIAGFFKHNIIAMPFAALLWLAIQGRWVSFFRCLAFSLFLMALGFLGCFMAYGRDFFFNFFTPRLFSLDQQWDALLELQGVGVVLATWLWIGVIRRFEPNMQLLNLLILMGLLVHFLQRTGDGVDMNSQFDLVIGVSLAAGMIFSHLGKLNGIHGGILQISFILTICLRLIFSENSRDILKIISPTCHHEISHRERIVRQLITQVHSVPGDVMSDAYLCYRAGKPFVVDEFNLDERIKTGKIAKETLSKRIQDHTLIKIEADPDIEW